MAKLSQFRPIIVAKVRQAVGMESSNAAARRVAENVLPSVQTTAQYRLDMLAVVVRRFNRFAEAFEDDSVEEPLPTGSESSDRIPMRNAEPKPHEWRPGDDAGSRQINTGRFAPGSTDRPEPPIAPLWKGDYDAPN